MTEIGNMFNREVFFFSQFLNGLKFKLNTSTVAIFQLHISALFRLRGNQDETICNENCTEE